MDEYNTYQKMHMKKYIPEYEILEVQFMYDSLSCFLD